MDFSQSILSSRDTLDDCAFRPLLGAFHDGELDSTSAASLQAHLQACDACRQELAEIQDLSALARQIGSEGISPAGLRRIHRALDAENQSLSVLRFAAVLTGLAASAMIVGTVWLAEIPNTGPRAVSHPIVIRNGDAWEAVAVNLDVDPLPREGWELHLAENVVNERVVDQMVQGLGGR